MSVPPGLMRPSRSAGFDQVEADTILDRTAGVLVLELQEQLARPGVEPARLEQRRASDHLERVGKYRRWHGSTARRWCRDCTPSTTRSASATNLDDQSGLDPLPQIGAACGRRFVFGAVTAQIRQSRRIVPPAMLRRSSVPPRLKRSESSVHRAATTATCSSPSLHAGAGRSASVHQAFHICAAFDASAIRRPMDGTRS